MDDKKFLKFLELLGKGKKVEEEITPKSQAEIEAHKARAGKTFYDRWMEGRDEREKL